ncbi:alanine dehydrogenase [Methylocystis parvus]|uniref:Alanine dehydrogenase n=1 Tax=Methylocystis parvus TaxID=134 RepID=A0A6B8M9N6_9HYPH|nr:alanine dehydrogenase [Methylocystis parvus]QGM97993.1 alanine dehydrogenase [Methylocystis parvus]WBK01692.1 alanine dehydrogenase [Methylocystis parvus OBBP]
MRIGVPKEIKNNEFRVGLTPSSVVELAHAGHEILVEPSAGEGAGLSDDEYVAAGAALAPARQIFERADLIVKVKEPQSSEVAMLRQGQLLFTYLHLAADRALTEGLMRSGAHCIAYETVTAPGGGLPLLAPMSEIAGRLAPQMGARFLEKPLGRGVLLSGAPGVPAAEVLILGAGSVGLQAATIALGMGANVLIADRSVDALRRAEARLAFAARTIYSTRAAIAESIKRADLVICAALTPGARAPILVTRNMIQTMKRGSVIVDVAIDQGGCCETSRPTSHADPVYVVDGVVHYCVTNMPGAVPRTSTFALNNATLPFVLTLANKGWPRALDDDAHLRAGLEITSGRIVSEPVAAAHGLALMQMTDVFHG